MDCSLEDGHSCPSCLGLRSEGRARAPILQARPPLLADSCIQRQSVSQVPDARSREPSKPTFAPSPLPTAQPQPELAQKRDGPDDAQIAKNRDDRTFRDNSHRRHPRAIEHSKHHRHSPHDRIANHAAREAWSVLLPEGEETRSARTDNDHAAPIPIDRFFEARLQPRLSAGISSQYLFSINSTLSRWA